jgi:hypothetical protein
MPYCFNITCDTEINYDLDKLVENIKDRIADEDDIDDTIHEVLDTFVSCNTNQYNMCIIHHLGKDIYDMMEEYKDNYGDFEARDKEHFYAVLAFHTIKEYYINRDDLSSSLEGTDEDEE